MNVTINFVLTSISQRAFKRIDSFIRNGYVVNVYCFDRGIVFPLKTDIKPVIIGSLPPNVPYLKRVITLIKGLRESFRLSENKIDDYWYYFGMPACVLGSIMNRRRYIYEESDMTHNNIRNTHIRGILERIDKYIIKRASISVFTSEGFPEYHFGKNFRLMNNIVVLPNKLREDIRQLRQVPKSEHPQLTIRFGFVGFIRYSSILNISDVVSSNFPNHELHFYGILYDSSLNQQFEKLFERDNVFYHGGFKNPDDLPMIYSNIDVLLSAYDTNSLNAQYAEPNKLYEAIFFRTPIIVSENTFLAKQVAKFGCGYTVDPFDKSAIINLVTYIENSLSSKVSEINMIPKDFAVDNSEDLFNRLAVISRGIDNK